MYGRLHDTSKTFWIYFLHSVPSLNDIVQPKWSFFRILAHCLAVVRVVGKHAKGMCIIRSQGPKLKHHALKSRSAKKKSQKIDGCQKREFFVSFPKVSLLSSAAAAIARKIGVSYYNFQFRSCIRYFSVCWFRLGLGHSPLMVRAKPKFYNRKVNAYISVSIIFILIFFFCQLVSF